MGQQQWKIRQDRQRLERVELDPLKLAFLRRHGLFRCRGDGGAARGGEDEAGEQGMNSHCGGA